VAVLDRRRIHVCPDVAGVHAYACQSTNAGCDRENFDLIDGSQHWIIYSNIRASLQCRSAGPATAKEGYLCRQAHR
jgi:hypothetical protein